MSGWNPNRAGRLARLVADSLARAPVGRTFSQFLADTPVGRKRLRLRLPGYDPITMPPSTPSTWPVT